MKAKLAIATAVMAVGMLLSGCSPLNTAGTVPATQQEQTEEVQTSASPTSSPTSQKDGNVTQEDVDNIKIEDDFNALVK